MSRRSLVVLRHGQTSWNASGRAQGWADVPLDEAGRDQAAAVAPVLAGLAPDAIWTSDLARARETAAQIEASTGLVAVPDRRLREYDVGERQGLTIAEAAERYGVPAASWWDLHESRIVPGAETTAEVAARFAPALEEMLASLAAGSTGIVVTHGAALKIGVLGLLGWSLELAETLEAMANCAWCIITETEDGRRRLTAYNCNVVDSATRTRPDFASTYRVG